MGANKPQLFQLSLLKIAMFVGLGLLMSWLLIAGMDSYLEQIFGSTGSLGSLSLRIILGGLEIRIPVTVLAALGMYDSGSGVLGSKKNFNVFGLLTIVQFAIVLIGFSVFVNRQIAYMDNKDLGYTDENIFIARIPSQQPRGSLLVEEIRKQSGVISASTAHHHPGDIYQSMEGWVINETFYNKLLRDFSPKDIAASNFSVGNDASDNPDDSGTLFEISGVMQDFHYTSLHSQIGNFAFVMRPPETLYNRWLIVYYAEGHSKDVLAAINQMMEEHFPGRIFDFFSLKDKLCEKYGAEARQIRTMLNLGFLKWVGIAFVFACSLTIWALKLRRVNFAYTPDMPWYIYGLIFIAVACIALIAVSLHTRTAARSNPVDVMRHE